GRTTTVYDNRLILEAPVGHQPVSGKLPTKAVAPLAQLPREETVEVPLEGGAKQQTQRTWTYSRNPAPYAPTYQQYASRVVETVKEIKGSTVTVVSETETLTELDAYGTPVKSTQLVHGANKTEQVEQVTTVGTLGFDQELWRPQGSWSVTSSWKSCARSPGVGCGGPADAANVRTQTFKFDGRGQVEIVELEPSLSGEGSLPPETSETYLKTTFMRDSRGLVQSVERAGGGVKRSESVTYDDVDQTQVVSSTDAEGATWKYLFHLGLGVLAQTADPNHVHTRFQYDGFGRQRVVTPLYRGPSVAPGDQSVVRTFYERYGALLQQRTQVATSAGTLTETITRFDVMGRPVSSQGPRFDGQTVVSSVSYDVLGRVEKLEAPRTSTESPTWESYEYDALNRVTARRVGDGISTTGTLVERLEYTVPTAYATQASVTDALGLVKKRVFDYRGLMVAATEAAGTPKAATMTYGYGPFGRLETTDDPQGNRSLNVYDAQGRLERSVDPGSGTRTYRYNAFGEVKREADGLDGMAGLLATTYERDRLGRVLSAKNNQEELAYEYDSGMGAMRRLTKATRMVLGGPPEVVTTQHFYDEFGRETDTQQDAAGTSLTMSRQFDDYGRLSRLTYPVTLNGQPVSISYAYNARGALSGIYRTGAFFMNYWSALERDSVGRLKKTRYGNGVERESRYDSRGRLRFLEAKRSGANVQRLAYEYTANDNLAARHDLMVGVTEKFSYDALDRLEWWRVLQNCQRLETQFQYDGLGNLLS
ncbi:MAG: RHS repeat protein, partial [Myxococcaceae bacterium]